MLERGARVSPRAPWSVLALAFVAAPLCAGRGHAGGGGGGRSGGQEPCNRILVAAPPGSDAAGCYALSGGQTTADRGLYTKGDGGEVSGGSSTTLGLVSVRVRFRRCDFLLRVHYLFTDIAPLL